VTLDLAALALLAVAAVLGARSGALRQVASLAAAAGGVLAARAFAPAVADGLARTVSPLVRGAAPALLFLGCFALGSLLLGAVLRWTGVARAVRGAADRGAGALLGGAKGALALWALLSALALAADALPRGIAAAASESDFAAIARDHNLVVRLDPDAARRLGRALEAARRARDAGRLAGDPDSARLLEQLGAVGGAGAFAGAPAGAPPALDPAQAARVLADPEVRALVDRLAKREQ
jgi:membrane protein required for colicin V production